MTPQEKLVLIAAAGTAAGKFWLGKDWRTSALIGLGALAAFAIVTARPETST